MTAENLRPPESKHVVFAAREGAWAQLPCGGLLALRRDRRFGMLPPSGSTLLHGWAYRANGRYHGVYSTFAEAAIAFARETLLTS